MWQLTQINEPVLTLLGSIVEPRFEVWNQVTRWNQYWKRKGERGMSKKCKPGLHSGLTLQFRGSYWVWWGVLQFSTRSHTKWQERATSAVQNSIGEKLKELMKKYKKVVDGLCRSGAGVDSEDECVEGIFLSALGGSEHWSHHPRCWIHPKFMQGIWRAHQCFDIGYSLVRAIRRPWKKNRQSSCTFGGHAEVEPVITEFI